MIRKLIPDKDLKDAVSISFTYSEVCRKLSVKNWGGSYYNICRRIKRLNLDTSHFYRKGQGNFTKGIIPKNKKIAKEILIFDDNLLSRTTRKQLLRSLLEIGRKYECTICKNGGSWNDQELQLVIDHIDGNWKNNTDTNLRFLCPNCHSQTNTFGNKKRTKKIDKRFLDKPHLRKVKIRPSLEILKQQIEEFGFVGTGKIYSVSDNAIRKWLKRLTS